MALARRIGAVALFALASNAGLVRASRADCPFGCLFDPPSSFTSTAPAFLTVVGKGPTGAIDVAGDFTIVLRDLANNPYHPGIVLIQFDPASDIELCGVETDGCAVILSGEPTVEAAVTAADGHIRMRIAGCLTSLSSTPTTARIFACGAQLADVPVAVLDLTGCDGLGVNDLSAWLGDFAAGGPHPRSDYDQSGTIGAKPETSCPVVVS